MDDRFKGVDRLGANRNPEHLRSFDQLVVRRWRNAESQRKGGKGTWYYDDVLGLSISQMITANLKDIARLKHNESLLVKSSS